MPPLDGKHVLVFLFLALLAFSDSVTPTLGGLHLAFYRVYLTVIVIPAVVILLRAEGRIRDVDWLVIGFAVLHGASLFLHYSPTDTLKVNHYSGAGESTNVAVNATTTLVETLGPYFLARATVRTQSDARQVMRYLILLIVLLGLSTAVEASTGFNIFQHAPQEKRYGFYRALGSFPGPIQWGVFAASAFSLSLADGVVGGTIARRAAVTVAVAIAALTSVSSAAIATIVVQILLLIWFGATTKLKHRGAYFLGGCVTAYLLIDLLSNRTPLEVIFYYAALDPATGWYRTLIWQFGWNNFLTSPLIGIGYHDWVRPHWMTASIDAFWLVILMRFGLIAALPLICAVGLAMSKVGKLLPRGGSGSVFNTPTCWIASFASLTIAAFTVHYWEHSFVAYFFLLGLWSAVLPLPSGRSTPEMSSEANGLTDPRDHHDRRVPAAKLAR